MTTYIILSRFSPQAFNDPKEFRDLANAVSAKIKKQCPEVNWKGSFATLGRFDLIDIVEADDPKQIERAAMIIRVVVKRLRENPNKLHYPASVTAIFHRRTQFAHNSR
ncbi:MAG TPA: GYD domain-containing protein [Candidatus Acidoferrales bacterium]|nr:GYD domain-containing protein [Candidatus Acidoferrales bacterium]